MILKLIPVCLAERVVWKRVMIMGWHTMTMLWKIKVLGIYSDTGVGYVFFIELRYHFSRLS